MCYYFNNSLFNIFLCKVDLKKYIFVLFLYFIILIILSAFDSFFLNTYVFNNYINIEIFVLFLTNYICLNIISII